MAYYQIMHWKIRSKKCVCLQEHIEILFRERKIWFVDIPLFFRPANFQNYSLPNLFISLFFQPSHIDLTFFSQTLSWWNVQGLFFAHIAVLWFDNFFYPFAETPLLRSTIFQTKEKIRKCLLSTLIVLKLMYFKDRSLCLSKRYGLWSFISLNGVHWLFKRIIIQTK